MIRLHKLITLLFFFANLLSGQIKLGEKSEISILSIEAGKALNDAFGHTAFRVRDPDLDIDIVYDYGRYDFETEGFYMKFIQGKLEYKIGWFSYDRFIHYYETEKRTVVAQILDLDLNERTKIFNFLRNNARPKNQFYLYDFFYDNCATKIEYVINSNTDNDIVLDSTIELKSFRELIRSQLNDHQWGCLGIDIALGSVIDQKASLKEHLFLPKYLKNILETSYFENTNKPVVKRSYPLHKFSNADAQQSFFKSPIFILGLLAKIILIISLLDYKRKKISAWLDALIFGLTGLIGLLVLFLWFGTNHTATAFNYNFLWAFALNLFLIPQALKNNPSRRYIPYVKFLVILLILLAFHWITGVQKFAVSLVEILLVIGLRYLFIIYYHLRIKN